MQSLLATMVESNCMTMADGAEIIARASRTLRRRSDGFHGAASILDQEERFWRSVPH
jgi:hypothetical protein